MSRPLGFALFLIAATAVIAAEPQLDRISPPGAQRGTAIRLDLYGSHLTADAKLLSSIPGSFTPLTASGGKMGPALSFLLELDADAPVGLYPLRLETSTGLTNLALFSVGGFAEVSEQESTPEGRAGSNDGVEDAQPIELPATVNGRLAAADRDVYRFKAKAGESVAIEVEARRTGSAIDPVLRVLDADGEQLAANNDAPGLSLDSRLRFRAPADGVYYAVIHDAAYSGQQADSYRLKIGDFDFADGFFPLGGPLGKQVEVEWHGGNLPQPMTTTVNLSAAEAGSRWARIHPPGKPGALPATFALSDREEEIESKDRTLTEGRILNGRISDTGEVDRYRLAVQPGQSWRIRVDAAELGSSELFPLLSVFDGEELLARSGDEIPEKGRTTLEENTLVSRDPFVDLEIPKETAELTVVVEDLVERGGPGFGYRLLAEQGPPDFELELNTPQVNIPAGGVAYVSATARRRGYAGPIQLEIDNPPPGISVHGGHLVGSLATKDRDSSSTSGTLALVAAPDAPQRSFELSLWGVGQLPGGEAIRRRASGPGLATAVRSRAGIRARQLPVRADWLEAELPGRVGESVSARIVIDGPSEVRIVKGTEYPLRWKLASDDPSIKSLTRFRLGTGGAQETTVSPRDPDAERDGEAYIKYLRTTMGAPEQKFDVTLTADVRIDGETETLTSPIITIELVEGFSFKPAEDLYSTKAGEAFTLRGTIERDPSFEKEVTVTAGDLPQGVSCKPSVAPPAQGEFRLECTAAKDAEAGLHELRLTGESVLAGRGKNVPYQIEPVTVALEIGR